MDRRRFLLTSVAGTLAAPLAAGAQQTGKIHRIGLLSAGAAGVPQLTEAFRQGLRDLGYIEGRNLVIEARYAAGKIEQLPALATGLVALGVDVIVTAGTLATRAAKNSTSTIPIVMVSVGDAVASGLVKSLRNPGGNVTGQSFMGSELAVKGFDILTEAVPRAVRLMVLFDPAIIPPESDTFRALEAAAQAKGLALQRLALRSEDHTPGWAAIGKSGPSALLVFGATADQQNRVIEFAARERLPALYSFREAVDAGGLMSVGPRLIDLWRGAAKYVDRILHGAKPGDLPVEQPTRFEFVLNLKTAKALGLTIPPSLLARADQVIE
jgi:putative tryptophan/tyrosine transport system substrate-binding protein